MLCSRASGRRAFAPRVLGWVAALGAAWLACSAPDGSDLYEPRPSAGAGGAAGGGGAGVAGTAGAAGEGTSGRGGANAVGPGGSSSMGGAAGGGAGGTFDGDAAAPSAPLDAGSDEDAGSVPPCAGPSPETCDGLDNDCDGVVDQGATCPNACVGFALAEHGYMFCPELVDRGIALARCEAQGMKLAWLEDAEENDALVLRIAELGVAGENAELVTQIGASDSDDEGEWSWVGNGASPDGFEFWEGTAAEDDGEPVNGAYQNWALAEPNDQSGEDCGVFSVLGSDNRDPGQWDDRNCDEEFAFLCEVP